MLLLLLATAAEFRLVSFSLHVLRDYLAVHELVASAGPQSPVAELSFVR